MDTASQQYRLRWNNHRSNLLTVFEELLENEAFTDVTLVVENGVSVKCHKMVLAACSLYFQNLFITLPCKHPIIVFKDVKHREIKAILEYMYRGEVNVKHEHLPGLLKIAEILKVKGLVEQNGVVPRNIEEEEEEGVETTSSPPPAISTSTATSSSAPQSSAHASISPGPHSTENVYNYIYGKHPLVEGVHLRRQPTPESLPLHMWPISAGLPLTQHHPSTHRQSILQSQRSLGFPRSFEEDCEPPPAPCLKRKFPTLPPNRDTPILRTVLGQGHADSSQPIPPLRPDSRDNNYRGSGSGSSHEVDRRSSTDRSYGSEPAHSSHLEASIVDDEDKQPSPQSFTGDSKLGAAGYGTNQKPEWKRYKQYTREDMMSAIEAVKSGMSALQAARKYGVPPRTLYDKVKKMGITTTRPLKRGSNGSGACFPYGIGGNANGSIYGSGYYDTETDNTLAGAILENSVPATMESTYVKWKDVPVDTGHRFTEPLSPPPVPQLEKQQPEDDEEEEEEEDQVEDLSVSRKPDVGVIVPPNVAVKEESNISTENAGNN